MSQLGLVLTLNEEAIISTPQGWRRPDHRPEEGDIQIDTTDEMVQLQCVTVSHSDHSQSVS